MMGNHSTGYLKLPEVVAHNGCHSSLCEFALSDESVNQTVVSGVGWNVQKFALPCPLGGLGVWLVLSRSADVSLWQLALKFAWMASCHPACNNQCEFALSDESIDQTVITGICRNMQVFALLCPLGGLGVGFVISRGVTLSSSRLQLGYRGVCRILFALRL